ncbi:PDZ domain-containing protein [Aurantibacter crassamenti]|uniref:PDZ domain-containing protein n=1 Tax=Aurantibacter crassamenti TaxID=1837375 RepID=UPI00193A87F3|nr:PDZ domain-containing protein [Aurantibacter crassamenti]MBM1105158.1 PDZ domain-containing protein [Aurantibacter crassamenti]
MKNKITHLLLFLPILLLLNCETEAIHLYVSNNTEQANKDTFKTISEALNKAKTIRLKDKKASITIHLTAGEYRLDQPLSITPELNGIQILGEGTDKVSIKGSQRLHPNWEKYEKQIWVAKVPDNISFDQLFIDHRKQVLARYPNYDEDAGHWQGHAADAISQERIKTWSNPIGAIVHAMHAGEWGGFHFTISGIDENGEAILSGGHQNNRPKAGIHENYRMVENVFEELDQPGEWFLNKKSKKLYYWPEDGLNLNDAIVEGVHLKNLINIKGTETTPVKDIVLQGIKFEHAQKTIMETYEPLLRSDWTIYRGAALFIEGTESVSVTDCEFVNLGGNAIFVSDYNRNTTISGNHIHECGATAISFVGNPNAVRSPSFQYAEFVALKDMDTVVGPANNRYPKECIADNNLIYRIGRLEKQTAGVEISMAMNITVSNNSIYEVPRAGINVSEGTWGGHIIEYNDVFNTVLESGDHGSFNSWGRDRFWHPNRKKMDEITSQNTEMPMWDAINTTIIRNNRFRCDHGWDIDLDDGSTNYNIYNNVCLNGGLKLREGFHRTVENNIMINNGFHPHVWFKNSGDIFRRNIVFTDHKDIRLQAWGKEVDYNIFPDQEALEKAQANNTDVHSKFGNPKFVDPSIGNYTVEDDSPALDIGFENFTMDNFGVKKPALKAIAKTPDIPAIWALSDDDNSKSMELEWLGAKIKNIETLAERSASGLNKTAGVLILSIEEKTVLANSSLEDGDVIIAGEGKPVDKIPDLFKLVQEYGWRGVLNLTIFRNQKRVEVELKIKK